MHRNPMPTEEVAWINEKCENNRTKWSHVTRSQTFCVSVNNTIKMQKT